MSSYSEGQKHPLIDTLEKAGWTSIDFTALGQFGIEGLEKIRLVVNGHAKIVSLSYRSDEVSATDPLSPIIRVDRSKRLEYPHLLKELVFPHRQKIGPIEFDLSVDVEHYVHPEQKRMGKVKGEVIFDYLSENNLFSSFFSLHDLEAIREKGLTFFQKYFNGKRIFAWKSVGKDEGGLLLVPGMYERDGVLIYECRYISEMWHENNVAPRYLVK